MSSAVTALSPRAAQAHLLDDPPLLIVDVRPPQERALACIAAPFRTLDQDGLEQLLALPKATALAFLCHHGVRSAHAAEYFLSHGFTRLHNIEGGIEAWAREADPSVPRY